jgi:hypothetical protein
VDRPADRVADAVRPEPAPAEPEPERAMRTCPVCGHELAERKCKLYCPRPGCGYFLSCADFY